jgi:hypothetical protein
MGACSRNATLAFETLAAHPAMCTPLGPAKNVAASSNGMMKNFPESRICRRLMSFEENVGFIFRLNNPVVAEIIVGIKQSIL